MPEGDVTEADDLYGLDPTEFTAARNALAKRLKAEDRKDDAAEVAQLRRPTATAWALNRVARDRPELITAALDAGARLRAATDAAVAGDAGGLREATVEDRAASDAVVDIAAAHLGARGAAARVQLTDNLRAAVLDDAVANELRRGVLSVDQAAAGFGFGFGFDVGADAATAAPPAPKAKPAAKASETAKDETPAKPKRAVAADAKERRETERRARQEAEDAARAERRRIADLEAEVKRLDRRYERLARVADRAEDEARQARAEADATALEAEAVRRALDDAI